MPVLPHPIHPTIRRQRQHDLQRCRQAGTLVTWASMIAMRRHLQTADVLRDSAALARAIAETLAAVAQERAATIILAAGDHLPPVPSVRSGDLLDQAVARLVQAERGRRYKGRPYE